MATGTSLLLIAIGLVMAIAVNYQVSGIDLRAVGVILVVVGALGLAFSLMFLASYSPFGERWHDPDHTTGHGHGHGHA
ncbi:MAG TPA: DUF6458 family protein [Dehalococcoidia bacterium]|nr:DUF6458 family protein [Dehalococcoidia bacterium]